MSVRKEDILSHQLPRHVAIIMDGNGRWAKKQNKERTFGHIHGIESVRKITEATRELSIPYLTLYTFSTENWHRPKDEVDTLMELLAETAVKETDNLIENNIKLNIIGDLSGLPEGVKKTFDQVCQATGKNHALTLSLALNYGGRNEIVRMVQNILKDRPDIEPGKISEKWVENFLDSGNLPDVDLMIRTGGEKRISNFLLWKIAYAELYFTPVLWPDFGKNQFFEAIADYQKRERRYGKTSEQIKNE